MISLHFRTEYKTDVYVSDLGYIVITQDNYPEDNLRVLLSPKQAKELLANLEDMLGCAEYLFEQKDDSDE